MVCETVDFLLEILDVKLAINVEILSDVYIDIPGFYDLVYFVMELVEPELPSSFKKKKKTKIIVYVLNFRKFNKCQN